jgi:hypothetical protein
MTDNSQTHKSEITASKPSSAKPKKTKASAVLKLLSSKRGATIAQLQTATGWQAHSVRGFLSGTVRKKLGHILVRETDKDGQSRYRIEDGEACK